MQVARLAIALLVWPVCALATILQNGQVKENPYPGQVSSISLDRSWKNYSADASEIAYKGRWDSKHVSWWSAPGIKLEFSGDKLAIRFGSSTSDGTLVAYRLGSLDWQYSNVTANSTYQFVGPSTNLEKDQIAESKAFEMRVQIAGVSVENHSHLKKPSQFKKKVEFIGGSLTLGQFGSYETLSSYAWLYAAGLGNVESTITAYPGVCMVDKKCYGGSAHGMTWYWRRASDPGVRSSSLNLDGPEKFDVDAVQPADLVIIQMGGNDARSPNEIPGKDFYDAYVKLIDDIHKTWPHAVILIMSQWGTWEKKGMTYVQSTVYEKEIKQVHEHYKDRGFVYYFETKGLLQHNDINPKNHLTDVGHVKIASHLLQWTRMVMGWELEPTGEVQHGTLYWNDQQEY